MKQIRLNAFDMNCPGHFHHGMWAHPRDRSANYTQIGYWQDLARTAERGLFDAIFLADSIGVYDVHGASPAAALSNAVQVPINDPLLVVPVMAAVTEHIGFGVTSNAIYEHPYLFARRLSTLDHLTRGRLGWNIVTGYLDSAARAMGLERQIDHDERYDLTDEYMQAIYALLEGSWEDDAVVLDRERRVYADANKVHPVHFQGRRHRIDGIHLSEPSPQRTPVLFQAGASDRGRRFAALHAECVFFTAATKSAARDIVQDIRARALANGRRTEDILFFLSRSVIVGQTRRDAVEKYEEYERFGSLEGALAHVSSSVGINLVGADLDTPLHALPTQAIRSLLTSARPSGEEPWTLRRLIAQMKLGSRTTPFVGSAEEVADDLLDWSTETGIDGFNLTRVVTPEGLEDFVDLVVPILQDRKAYKTAYDDGPLRRKLFGGSGRLLPTHAGALFRHQPPPVPTGEAHGKTLQDS